MPQGYAFCVTNTLRTLRQRVLAMAAISGYQLWNWYQTHRFCGSCGRHMRHDTKERMLRCDYCGNRVYPKIMPAVIVAVLHEDALILTRYAGRSYRKDALIAGFCEIGETLEDTVRREVMEEVGLQVKNIRYYKSQPWSFTDTLLAGFFCEVSGEQKIVMGTQELSMARWVARSDIPEDEEGVSLTAEMMSVFKKYGHLWPQTVSNMVK